MKNLLIVVVLVSFTTLLLGQGAGSSYNMTTVSTGIGLGSAIAVVASWSRNKSVLWAIIHAFFGWLYVIYYVLTRSSARD